MHSTSLTGRRKQRPQTNRVLGRWSRSKRNQKCPVLDIPHNENKRRMTRWALCPIAYWVHIDSRWSRGLLRPRQRNYQAVSLAFQLSISSMRIGRREMQLDTDIIYSHFDLFVVFLVQTSRLESKVCSLHKEDRSQTITSV